MANHKSEFINLKCAKGLSENSSTFGSVFLRDCSTRISASKELKERNGNKLFEFCKGFNLKTRREKRGVVVLRYVLSNEVFR